LSFCPYSGILRCDNTRILQYAPIYDKTLQTLRNQHEMVVRLYFQAHNLNWTVSEKP
jgi:hypothetical protein